MNDFKYIDYNPEVLRKTFEEAYRVIVGGALAKGDPISDFLDYVTFISSMIYSKIDYTGKMNLLRYSKGEFLDALGEIVGEEREPSKKALTTIKYKFSKTFQSVIIIPKGHKTESRGIYFETISATPLQIGMNEIEIKCECTLPGEIGNGFEVGEISTIVDSIAYLESISNVTRSQGGAEKEEDETLKEKIRINPASRSVAGPEASYIYHTKKSHQDVIDVYVTSPPRSGIVKIYPLLKNGEIPQEDILEVIKNNLNNKDIKPLTDQVQTLQPEVSEYDINLTYFITDDITIDTEKVKKDIETSIQNYIDWQCCKLGRDINPNQLIRFILNNGAKRVELSNPVFTKLEKIQVAKLKNKIVNYGGKEIE